MNKEKYKFCPEKVCPYCGTELKTEEDEIITGCKYCKRSFVD